MKKIIASLALSGLSVGAFAQGYINWSGSSVSLICQTNGTAYSSFVSSVGAPAPSGTQGSMMVNNAGNNAALGYSGYYFELLTSASASTVPTATGGFSAWSDTGLGATSSTLAAGRLTQTGSGASVSVNNWPVGATQSIILVGWSANLGTSWNTVLGELQNWQTAGGAFSGANAAYFGVSTIGSGIQAVASTGSANQVIGAGAGEIYNPSANPMQLYQLAVVPEPATMALAAIGGASLLLFRRKK